MATTRHRVRLRPQIRRVFRAGYPGTRVSVQQLVPGVNMPLKLQKSFRHAANDPAQYSHNIYQLLRMQLLRLCMIMSTSGRIPGYSVTLILTSPWLTCLTIPPHPSNTKNKRPSPTSRTLELRHFTYVFLRDSGLQRDPTCLGLTPRRGRTSNSAHST